MRVRLLTRWGSRMRGDIVGVSAERAAALEKSGIGRILDAPPPVNVEKPAATAPEPDAQQDKPKTDKKK